MRITLYTTKKQLTPDIVSRQLALVSIDLPESAMERWTENELALVSDWCMREHLRASDNVGIRRRPKPAIIELAGGKPIDPTLFDVANLFPKDN